jgi:hypothetical protein
VLRNGCCGGSVGAQGLLRIPRASERLCLPAILGPGVPVVCPAVLACELESHRAGASQGSRRCGSSPRVWGRSSAHGHSRALARKRPSLFSDSRMMSQLSPCVWAPRIVGSCREHAITARTFAAAMISVHARPCPEAWRPRPARRAVRRPAQPLQRSNATCSPVRGTRWSSTRGLSLRSMSTYDSPVRGTRWSSTCGPLSTQYVNLRLACARTR